MCDSLYKRLHNVLSVNRIHTRVFFSVNQIQTINYDYFHDSHSSDANGQMTYYDWSILSIPSTSLTKDMQETGWEQPHGHEVKTNT